MSKLILINSTPEETRVALIENEALAEMHIERARDHGIVGNIYKGKVVRVLPGMQAAFVDIGLAKAGFLHVSDFYPGVTSSHSSMPRCSIGPRILTSTPLDPIAADYLAAPIRRRNTSTCSHATIQSKIV